MLYTVGYEQEWKLDGSYKLRLDILYTFDNGQLTIYDWNHTTFKSTTAIDGRNYGYNYLYGTIEIERMDLERANILRYDKRLIVLCNNSVVRDMLREIYGG